MLGALGYRRVWATEREIGYGLQGTDDKFAIKSRDAPVAAPSAGFHVAFAAPSTGAVHAFHEHALVHGGRDDGAPGPRPQYGADYYAAFVIDPDGYRIEAVHARAEADLP